MSIKGDMNISDISKVLKMVENYGADNLEEHISELQNRIQVINQTVRDEDTSPEALRLGKVHVQFQGLKDKYISLETDFPVEDKINVMKRVSDINKQIERFEGKPGEKNEN